MPPRASPSDQNAQASRPRSAPRQTARTRQAVPARAARPSRPAASPVPQPSSPAEVEQVDTRYLQTLIGYNARRAALSIIEIFLQRMAPFGLRPVDFSVMSVIHHNPGVTSRQLCTALNLLPPNLVGLVQDLQSRGLIEKKPHPRDGRAVGLYPTPQGRQLMAEAESTAVALESDRAHRLSPQERQTLLALLQKIYL